MSDRLKVGVLLESYSLPAWKYGIIEEIVLSDFAEISVIILGGNTNSTDYGKKRTHSVICRLHNKLEMFIFRNSKSYCKIKDIKAIIKNTPEIKAQTITNCDVEEFIQSSNDEVKKYNLDIILKFGFGILKGQIISIAKYGVWSYTMDNYGIDTGGISGYIEFVTGNPVTKSELVILNDAGEKDSVISDAFESTCSYSIHLNRNRLFWRASLFVPRVIQGLQKYGSTYLDVLKDRYRKETLCTEGKASTDYLKGSFRYFRIVLKHLMSKIIKKAYFTDPFSWILLYRINEQDDFLNNSYGNFRKLKPSKDRFWADPFVITKSDKYYVFVEEFIYGKNKGHISVLELNNKGELLNSKTVIDNHYHMSYPHVFESGGTYYMIPETGENRTIDLYKSVEFPLKWVFVKSIMSDINAMDSTMFFYKNKWWLFTLVENISFASDNSPELYVYYNDDIFSDKWKSHPLNPVVSDVRNARPAGNIFIKGGNIYRPSQDCSVRYGRALNFNQILVLSEEEYEEKQVSKVLPDWDNRLRGVHTYNFDNEFSIIDAYYFRRRLN